MAEIIDAVLDDSLDGAARELRAVLKRTVREFELAVEKVAANSAQPAAFPLPDDMGSTEQLLARRFRALPAVRRQQAETEARHRIQVAPAIRAKALGDLAAVELGKPTAVEKQVAALPMPGGLKLTMAQLQSVAPQLAAGGPSPAAAPPPMRRLELRIHEVHCVDETNGFLGSEAGSDEIDLGGTAVDETGDTHTVAPFRVASFDDGDRKVFDPPRRFTTFDLTEGTAFPKGYVVALALAEIDSGGFNDFVRRLSEKVKERVIAALAAAVGGAIGVSGGPVGVAIGIAVGWVVGKVFDLLANVWKDDVFAPARVRVSIPSLTARWNGATDSPQRTVAFRGHGGHYTLTYDWRVFN